MAKKRCEARDVEVTLVVKATSLTAGELEAIIEGLLEADELHAKVTEVKEGAK